MKKDGPLVELKVSGDGSHTLHLPGLNEHYHSIFGAITESRHIFIEAGFRQVLKHDNPIRILEIGFGTGLNALLTIPEAEKTGKVVEYTSIERYPLNQSVYLDLNYPSLIDYPGCRSLFLKLHESAWDKHSIITKSFHINKIHSSLDDYIPEKEAFCLVYFDAFGPDIQSEMWTIDVFSKMASALKKDGMLVTYSTKGAVKRNLKEAGFSIVKLPGPKGKREILRAIKL